MVAMSPFNPAAGPADLIDRMIGEEYAVVKQVADRLPDLDDLVVAIDAAGGLAALTTGAAASRDGAQTAASAAAASAATAVTKAGEATASKDTAVTSAATAVASATTATTKAAAADASAISAAGSAVTAGLAKDAAATSATNAGTSATNAATAFTLADAARVAAQQAKADAIAIVGFDGSNYALKGGAPAALDTLGELAQAIGNDPAFSTTVSTALATKAPLASPVFTGNPTAPTPTAGDNDQSIATTAFVTAAVSTLDAAIKLRSKRRALFLRSELI